MAARPLGVRQIKHQDVARACRETPGEWVEVRSYRSRATAMEFTKYVNTGKTILAYLPSGSFEGRYEMVDDGYMVFARYVGTPEIESSQGHPDGV